MRRPRPAAGSIHLWRLVFAAAAMIVVPYLAYRITGHELGDRAYWGNLAGFISTVLWWLGLALLLWAFVAYVRRELTSDTARRDSAST